MLRDRGKIGSALASALGSASRFSRVSALKNKIDIMLKDDFFQGLLKA